MRTGSAGAGEGSSHVLHQAASTLSYVERPLPVPQQLPGDVRSFVNRSEELRQLNAILAGHSHEPLVLPVHVITGMAGVGKTSLALHWAHQARERFPDGQLYVNLRGYDPGFPVTAQEALNGFLLALQVPTGAIPAGVEAAAALYRSMLAGRRMLVILDNAATVEQVRPLLPGTGECLVLVTSRSRLSGLAVRDGAHRLALGTLAEPEAVTLLRTLTAGYRASDNGNKLVELAGLCAMLPLALRVAAERVVSHPFMRLDDLIGDLQDKSALWEALSVDGGGEADAVHTVFAWSYSALSADAARLFRLLGLHPGPEFGSSAVAALAAVSPSIARRLLDVLAGAHLLEQRAPDRYEFHDLLHAYATDRAQHDETAENREAAVRRVLEWYLHSAESAQRLIYPSPHPPLDTPGRDVVPMRFSDYTGALAWYEQERANLMAATRAAENSGLDRIAWQLPAVLQGIHVIQQDIMQYLAMNEIGLRAARRLGDREAQAGLLRSLGGACNQLNHFAEAMDYLQEALVLRRELGDRVQEGLVLTTIGLIHLRQWQLDEARAAHEKSLAILRDTGAARHEADSLANLAEVNYELGQLAEAEDFCRRALAKHHELNNWGGEGDVLRILSAVQRERGALEDALWSAQTAVDMAVHHHSDAMEGFWLLALGRAQQVGQLEDALASYQRAAELQQQLGNRTREALAWQGIGEVQLLLGHLQDSADFHRRAAETHRELGDNWQLAIALNGLATALQQAGRKAEAQQHRTEALRLLTQYDDPRAMAMRARISAGG